MNGNKKKIIFIIRDFSFGGINTVTGQVATYLSSLKSFDIIIISLSKRNGQAKEKFPKNNNTSIYYFDEFVDGYLGVLSRMLNYIVPFIGTILLSSLFSRLLLTKIKKIDNVSKVYLCGFGVYSNFLKIKDNNYYFVSHNIKSKLLKKRCGFFYNMNRKWLCSNIINKNLLLVSSAIKNDWVNNITQGFMKDAEVIYNPINIEKNKKMSDEYKIPYDNYFVYCGRLEKEKNVDKIINAWNASGVKSKLVIVGDGTQLGYLKEIANCINPENIIFVGRVSNPYPYIKNARGLILFSDFEGLPTVALEAIGLGVNLIINECGGAAYDVIQEEFYNNIINGLDTNLLAKQILIAERSDQFVYPFENNKYDIKSVAMKYVR